MKGEISDNFKSKRRHFARDVSAFFWVISTLWRAQSTEKRRQLARMHVRCKSTRRWSVINCAMKDTMARPQHSIPIFCWDMQQKPRFRCDLRFWPSTVNLTERRQSWRVCWCCAWCCWGKQQLTISQSHYYWYFVVSKTFAMICSGSLFKVLENTHMDDVIYFTRAKDLDTMV